MRKLKVLQRSESSAPPPVREAAYDADALGLCPAARCARCNYEFEPYTVATVCPRCLEPFTRDPCYAGCTSCPLLIRAMR